MSQRTLNKAQAFYKTGEKVWRTQGVDKAIETAINDHKFHCKLEVDKKTANVIAQFGSKCLDYRVKKSPAPSADRMEITVHWND